MYKGLKAKRKKERKKEELHQSVSQSKKPMRHWELQLAVVDIERCSIENGKKGHSFMLTSTEYKKKSNETI